VIASLVVDANPLLSALLGGSARQVLFASRFTYYAAQHTLFEVAKYLPIVAAKLRRSESDLFREYELLPVVVCQPREYEARLPLATQLIGLRDPKDVHTLALALRFHVPIWTEDRDFDGLPGVKVFRTAELLAELKS
jgi:predicted nucleic acid-binding protein